MSYGLLGDLVGGIHFLWVLWVVLGLVLFLVGGARGWKWVRNRWVRGIHLAMIAGVIARATVWQACPLTYWEETLRELPGGEPSALGWFFHAAIHPPLPIWVFLPLYSLFGLLVVGAFWWVPVEWSPRRSARGRSSPGCEREADDPSPDPAPGGAAVEG
ncbi:MAG: DUF2784 domain-containing protein [Gemmataceae bacterium]|nr:DUF2784 domain-containing protein [Gemmataceae bacterium]